MSHCAMIGGQTKTPTMSVLFERKIDYVGAAPIVAKHLAAAGGQVIEKDFDEVRAKLIEIGIPVIEPCAERRLVQMYDEEIKGIDAPRPKLSAGIDGVWGAGADEKGISMEDYRDVNMWREITHNQTGPKAYDIAKKVWPEVEKAKTVYEAARILRDAGARLHGYCGMD